MGNYLASVITVGLATAFWAGFVSQFKGSPQWVKRLRAIKPFGCPLCMSFWTSVALSVLITFLVPGPIVSVGNWPTFLLLLFKMISAVTMVSILVLAALDRLEVLFLTNER